MTDCRGKRYKSAEELGLVPQRRPPTITRIEPPNEIGGFDLATRKEVIPASTTGSHQDRAKAFNIRTKHVSLAAATASVPLAVVGFSVPLLSLPILLWLFGSYAAVWFASFMWDVAASPDGVNLIRTLYEAGEIRAERKERHRYYQSMYRSDDK